MLSVILLISCLVLSESLRLNYDDHADYDGSKPKHHVPFDLSRIPMFHEDGCQKLELYPPGQHKFIDGTWPICYDVVTPAKGCVVLNAGAFDDISFDTSLAKKGCEVHTFDPTLEQVALRVPGAGKVAKEAENNHIRLYDAGFLGNDTTFNAGEMPYTWPGIGYGSETNTKPWRMVTLGGALKEIGHSQIDLLKFDIEGAEWPFLSEALSNPETRKVFSKGQIRQINMEVHFMPPPGDRFTRSSMHPKNAEERNQGFSQILKDLESTGFQMVWHEPNDQWCHNVAFVWKQA